MNSDKNGCNSIDSNKTEVPNHFLEDKKDIDPSEIKILIVEDTDINRIILTKLLKSRNFYVESCVNGLEALEILEMKDFDIILMDVEMPKMNGLIATQKIREKEMHTGKHIPIIAITAQREPEECFLAGMDAYVPKLISGKELFSTIFEYYKKFNTFRRNENSNMISNLKLDELPVFDRDKVLENLMGDMDLLNELVGMFSQELPDFCTKINGSFEEGNFSEVKKRSHQLKGAAGFSGARRIERIALEIQQLSEDDTAPNIGPLLTQLEIEKIEFLKAINIQ